VKATLTRLASIQAPHQLVLLPKKININDQPNKEKKKITATYQCEPCNASKGELHAIDKSDLSIMYMHVDSERTVQKIFLTVERQNAYRSSTLDGECARSLAVKLDKIPRHLPILLD
jgi:hypothetical protein